MATNKELEAIKQEVFQLISENKIPEAVGKLMTLYKNSEGTYFDDLLLLSRQYKDVTDRQMSGLLDDQKASIEKNRVSHGIINILNNLHTDPAIAGKFGIEQPSARAEKQKPFPFWAWLIPLLAVSGFVLFFIFNQNRKESSSPPVTAKEKPQIKAEQQTKLPEPQPDAGNQKDQQDPVAPPRQGKPTEAEVQTPISGREEKPAQQAGGPAVSAHNNAAAALSLELNQAVTHTLLSAKDIHYYNYQGTDGERIGLRLDNQTATFLPQVSVYDERGMRLQTSSVRAGGEDYSTWFRSSQGKTFQIVIANRRNSTGGRYQLTLVYE